MPGLQSTLRLAYQGQFLTSVGWQHLRSVFEGSGCSSEPTCSLATGPPTLPTALTFFFPDLFLLELPLRAALVLQGASEDMTFFPPALFRQIHASLLKCSEGKRNTSNEIPGEASGLGTGSIQRIDFYSPCSERTVLREQCFYPQDYIRNHVLTRIGTCLSLLSLSLFFLIKKEEKGDSPSILYFTD